MAFRGGRPSAAWSIKRPNTRAFPDYGATISNNQCVWSFQRGKIRNTLDYTANWLWPMTLEKDVIRVTLPPLKIGEPVVESELVSRYREYYGIDFEKRIPGLQASLGTVDIIGYSLVVHTFMPKQPRATVFVLHGYYDHVGIYDHLIEYLIKHNFAVISYDLPGHGLTTGDPVAIPDFHRYRVILKTLMELLDSQLPRPWYAVGQSTGAAILIDYLISIRDNLSVNELEKVVLLAPLIRPRNWLVNRMLHSVLSLFKDYGARTFSYNSNDQTFVHFLRTHDPLQSRLMSAQWVAALKKWIPMVETCEPIDFSPLIIQGQLDGTVQWEHNIPVLQRLFNSPPVVYIPRLRHQVVNEHVDIRNVVFSLVVEHFAKP